MPQLGENLRATRRSRRLSLDHLAAAARIPSTTLALIERGEYNPRLSEIERLLQALRVTFQDLLGATAGKSR